METKNIFSQDYIDESKTNTETSTVQDELDIKEVDSLQVPIRDYEVSKPRRVTLRGKIINGKS